MTLCSGRGIWTVEADFPQYQPPKIRWHWGDAVWQEVEGDRYRLTSQTKTYPGERYNIVVWRQDFRRTALSHFGFGGPWEPANSSAFIYLNNFEGEIVGLGLQPDVSPHPDAPYGLIHNNGNSFWSMTPLYQIKDYQYYPDWRVNAFTLEIVSIRRITDNGFSRIYTLEIYRNNIVVSNQTGTVEPTIEQIPETCTYLSNWEKIYTENNLIQEAFLKGDLLGSNTVSLKKCLGFIENNEIKAICEQVGSFQGDCNHPKLRGKVEPLCPTNTCEIENCGSEICCYDANGYAVRSY